MELTRDLVETRAREYEAEEPLYGVEQEQIETLPGALAAGEYGWRDVEWIVRWYFRRFLGAYPDAERRAREDRWGENDFEAVRRAVEDAGDASDAAAAVDPLTALEGVDVPLASAILAFLEPGEYVVVGEREWSVLAEAGELEGPYPDPPSLEEYESYLATCRSLAERFEVDLWTLYRALWRLFKDDA